MHKEGYYSSGEFAKKANVTVRTIRYYDKQNILKPSLLTEDGVRFIRIQILRGCSRYCCLSIWGFRLRI